MDPRVKTPRGSARAIRPVRTCGGHGADARRAARGQADEAKFKEGPPAKQLADRESKLTDLNAKLTALYTSLQEVDAAPTAAMVDAATELRRKVTEALAAPAKAPPR
jgi:hypothetical protein